MGNQPTTKTDPSGLEETKGPNDSEGTPFEGFPPLPIDGLPVDVIKPNSPFDNMNVSIDELLIRIVSLQDKSASKVCWYGPDTQMADQLWNTNLVPIIRTFREEWLKKGAATYPGLDGNGEDYDSGIQKIPYVSPGKNIIRDGASYYFGLGHANMGHLGSFTIYYRATIDCERKEARIRIRAYNVWSIESLLRNPVTRKPLVEGPNVPKVPIIIDIDETHPLR